jgi:hypothetical protein
VSISGSNSRNVPPPSFLARQRHVGRLQQHIRVGPVTGGERDPNAGAHQNGVSRDVTGGAQRVDDAFGQARGIGRVMRGALQQRELVTTEPSDHVAFPDAGCESLRYFNQQRVPDGMAQSVVHGLEPVEIEAEHGEGFVARQPGQRSFHLLMEQHAVRQAGQPIMTGHVGDLRLGTRALPRLFLQ